MDRGEPAPGDGKKDQEEILTVDARTQEEMQQLCGRGPVPQIVIDDQPIGGFDELYSLDEGGELDRLLGRQTNAADD